MIGYRSALALTGLILGIATGGVPTANAKTKLPVDAPSVTKKSPPASVAPQNSDSATPDADIPEEQPTAAPKAATTVKAPPAWSHTEIAEAKARCDVILKKIHAVAVPQVPIKEGACGAPAPIELISIGAKPQISINPPAILTCEMAEALSTWVEGDLQPLAKKHLGSEIITIETMSSYACRNAYGRKNGKLSEHGIANALDIRGFITASAKTAYVLEDWGTPQREILARIAAQKAAAEAQLKLVAARAAAETAAQANQLAVKTGKPPATPPSATASAVGTPASGIAKTTIEDGISKLTITLPGGIKPNSKVSDGLAITEPDKLGGPKNDEGAKSNRKTEFLHEAHEAACRIFGTTLGPEANSEHRNHFHVDMAARKTTKICD